MFALSNAPPGLTHDEAGHGHDAAGVLQGVTPIYFTVGYGREPLFDYLNAGFIAGIGKSIFTLRFAAAVWGLLTVAVTYAFARAAFDTRVALIGTALLAVSFWPVATGRQVLRSGLLSILLALAGWAFIKVTSQGSTAHRTAIVVFTLAVGASLYTYIPARVLWIIYPLTLVVLFVGRWKVQRRSWTLILLGLVIAAAISAPLFGYLRANPNVEQRLEMLDEPLEAIVAGNLRPIVENVGNTLQAFFRDGFGDDFLAYNIPGRPVFELATFAFFLIGVLASLRRWRSPPYALSLVWLAVGISPALVIGPGALTTRIIGAQPVIHVLAAIGAITLWNRFPIGRISTWLGMLSITIWIGFVGGMTIRDYFGRWANDPRVRAAYHNSLLAGLDSLAERELPMAAMISSPLPGVAHDPYIAELSNATSTIRLNWADGQTALLLPATENAQFLFSGRATLHPAFEIEFINLDEYSLRANDLDPNYSIGVFNPTDMKAELAANLTSPAGEALLDGAIGLIGAAWITDNHQLNDVAELLTMWQVIDPERVGPPMVPAGRSDLVLFTHVLDTNGSLLSQRDKLGAPSWQWELDDVIVQIHALPIPEINAGEYRTVVGIYERQSGIRLKTPTGADVIEVSPLQIAVP